MYFLLLCKKRFEKVEYFGFDVKFFKFFFRQVCRDEIKNLRDYYKEKYCVLIFFVFFKNNFNVKNLFENKFFENIFRCVLKVSGLDNYMFFYDIRRVFDFFCGFYVKKIGDSYQFFNDIIMEIIILCFGEDYFVDLIRNVDISFI